MNCNAVQTRLSAYLDRELTGDELLQLRAHLSQCHECRAEETELRNLKALLGNMSAPDPSADFADRLCATVLKDARQPEPRLTWRRSFATFAGVAAASMALTFFVTSLQSNGTPVVAQPVGQDMAMEVARDQAFTDGGDPTGGASLTRFANYAGR